MHRCRDQKPSLWIALVLAAGTLVLPGCGDHPAAPSAAANPAIVRGSEHRFAITIGGQTVQMRLAVHDTERSQGLMHITQMPEDEGMLFVWARPQPMRFFMRNTRLPLDIGFIDADGVLREVHPMYPGIEDSVESSAPNLQLALEMNQGWFARHGVKPGATIDLAGVRAALHERGYKPEKFFRAK